MVSENVKYHYSKLGSLVFVQFTWKWEIRHITHHFHNTEVSQMGKLNSS